MAETKQGEGLSFEAGLADELLCKAAKEIMIGIGKYGGEDRSDCCRFDSVDVGLGSLENSGLEVAKVFRSLWVCIQA